MKWDKIRSQYVEQWLLIEAIQAHSENGKRILDDISVLEGFSDSADALRRYLEIHKDAPNRELYVVHTGHEDLDISERKWFGIRAGL